MYLVDTSAWIDFLKKKDDRLIPYLESRDACLSDIILYELLSGTAADKQEALRGQLSLFPVLFLTEEACLLSARIASDMRRKGMPPQTTDMLISGTALVHRATVIHRDKDFERIKRFSTLKTISLLP